jgi:gliding motility-associated-like protein
VNSLPGVSAAISASTAATCPGSCDGTATVLASGGNGPYQYNWLATSQTTASATALCAATHSVVVTDSNGCQDTAVVAITEPAAFALSIATPPWLCIGQSATLTATVTGGTPAYTYNWSPSGPAVSPVTTTTYTLSVTDANGCVSATQTVTVNVHPPLSVTASGGGTTCTGTTVTLTASASGGNGGPYFYGWTPNMQAGSTVNVTPTTTTTYTVNVTDNCTVQQATATTQAFVPTVPSVTFSAVSPEGCANMCTQFTSNTPNGFSMLWHFGDGGTSTAANPTHCFTQDGSYTVTLEVTDGFGCTYTFIQPNMIIVHPNPVADFTLGPQPTTILEPQICFTSTSSPDVNQWYWNFGDVNDQVTDSTASTCHSYSDTGHYCVDLIVHNSYGCFSTVEYCLEIQPYFSIYVPNAFTPNSDGKNDAFMPSLYNVDPSSYEMQIFDRWGNLIFTTTNTGEGWDGRAKGKSQVAQIDTYVWKIFVRDYTGHSHALVGHVSIIK